MQAENTFYIGLSERTNKEGIAQANKLLTLRNKKCITVDMPDMLHPKTGVAYLGNNTLLAVKEFAKNDLFKSFKIIPVPEQEAYAANSIRVNDYVILPKGFEKTKQNVEQAGFKVETCDVSEFQKLDGGLSCLSIRF